MTEPRPRRIEDARELVDMTELRAIHFYEVRGRRHEGVAGDRSPEPKLHIQHRGGEDHFEIRCSVEVRSPGAVFVADAAARFDLAEPLEIPQEVMQEFIERVGLMTVYPFLREAVLETSARLGVERTVLGLLRPGRVPVERDGAAEVAANPEGEG